MAAPRGPSPVTRVVALGLALIGVAVVAIVYAPGGTAPLRAAPLWLPLVVGAAFGVAERAVFHLEHRREAITFSLSEVPSIYALVFLDIRLAVAIRVVCGLAVVCMTRRPPLHKLLFNAGLFALEIAVAACVLRVILTWTGDSMTWLLAGGVIAVGVLSVVGSLLVCVAIAQFEGEFVPKALTELRASIVIFALNATIAGLTLAPGLVTPSLALFALAPIALLWIFVRQQGEVAQTLRDVESIQGFAGRIAAEMDLPGIGRAGVDDTARLLRSRQAGLVIFDGDVALMTISAGAPLEGLPARTDDPRWSAVLSCVDAEHPACAVGDMFAVPVLSDQRVVGLLAVSGREGAADSFTEPDLRRLCMLADQLAGALARGLTHRHLEYEASHDVLTGLANRAAFDRYLEGIRERALEQRAIAFVAMLDLDRFKDVNDTLGHDAGDRLLVEIAHRLSAVPDPHDLLARFAGDEFALSGIRDTVDEIDALVRACTSVVARPFSLDGLELVINASAGIATHSGHADSADMRRRVDDVDTTALLRRADLAMYHAKQNHLGHEFYRDEIDRRTPARLSMLADLRTTIDRFGIELHFQPKLDLVSNVVSGAEALARWNHPTRGSIPPIEFIKVAEESGLIRSLTDLVLESSIGAIAALDARGHRLGIAVNLSTQDLLDELLCDRVERRLEQFGVEPARLTLEITEGTLLYDGLRTRSTIERLHEIGVHLSIDDFGTGYSSLSYLRQLPVTELKIDRSFVTNLVVDAQDETIVRSTIDLGHNLGLQVVAEGVETNDVVDRLRALGCDIAQGYGICRPLPLDQLATWLVNTSFATRQDDPTRTLPW